jgi:hypothetical protein
VEYFQEYFQIWVAPAFQHDPFAFTSATLVSESGLLIHPPQTDATPQLDPTIDGVNLLYAISVDFTGDWSVTWSLKGTIAPVYEFWQEGAEYFYFSGFGGPGTSSGVGVQTNIYSVNVTPEPSTAALLAVGVVVLAVRCRRARHA